MAFDAIGGAHFGQSFDCLAPGGLFVGYGSQTMALGRESLVAAGLGLARLKLWSTFSFLFGGRSAIFFGVTARRSTHLEEFKAEMAGLFQLLRAGAIRPAVVARLPLAMASEVHTRIDCGGLGGKIVLLPWPDIGQSPLAAQGHQRSAPLCLDAIDSSSILIDCRGNRGQSF